MSLPFSIKICGLTVEQDVIDVASLGITAIGLNLSKHSVRRVDLPTAINLASAFHRETKKRDARGIVAGVFVEQSIEQANEIAGQVGLDMIQLHGDHPLDCIGKSKRPVIWVLRVKSDSSEQLVRQISDRLIELKAWQEQNPALVERLAGVLLDAHVEGEWGGTGQSLAWEPLRSRHQWDKFGAQSWPRSLPLILAGGISPDNIHAAQTEAAPEAVDIASGVESAPGRKSLAKLQKLLTQIN